MSKRNNNDLGLVVIHNMVKNGIATLPRNYELYYSAFSGNYPDLKKKVLLLGQSPTQGDIDEIADQFFPERVGASVVQKAGNRMGKQVESLKQEVTKQSDNLSTFAAAVEGAKIDMNKENSITALTVLLQTAGLIQEDLFNSDQRLNSHKIALEVAQQEINDWKTKAYTDKLTKLKNRAAFDEYIHAIYEKPDTDRYSLILFDIDHFKLVNDTYGHPWGDRILQLVAEATEQNVRDALIARYGGEEFGIIIKNASPKNVDVISERLRLAIERMHIQSGNKPFKGVTISIGSCMASNAGSATELIKRADEALYTSKNTGRNRATQWTSNAFIPDQTTGGALKMYR